MPYAANGQISQAPITGGIEITEEQYQEALNGIMQGHVVSIEGGFSVAAPVEPEPEPEPEPTLDELKHQKQQQINSAYSSEMSAILSQYPNAETLTWDKQESEARAYAEWQANGGTEPSTPIIDAIAQGRQMPKEELVTRIIDKANAWIDASGYATGNRQALEDRINNAETVADIDAIKW